MGVINEKWLSRLNIVILNIRLYYLTFFNALGKFQKYVNKILAQKLNNFVIIYFDNILIYIENLNPPYIKAIC